MSESYRKATVYVQKIPAGGRNKYYLNGVEITQAQARQHAMEVTGHYMTNSEWK